jgi:hypothetical protein
MEPFRTLAWERCHPEGRARAFCRWVARGSGDGGVETKLAGSNSRDEGGIADGIVYVGQQAPEARKASRPNAWPDEEKHQQQTKQTRDHIGAGRICG